MPASRTVTARRLAWPVSSLTARPLAPKGAACLDAHEQTLACRVPSSHTSPYAVPVITMAAGQPAGERLPGLGGDNFLQTLYVSPPKGPIPSDWTFRGVGEPGGKVGPAGGELVCGFHALVIPKPHAGHTRERARRGGTESPGPRPARARCAEAAAVPAVPEPPSVLGPLREAGPGCPRAARGEAGRTPVSVLCTLRRAPHPSSRRRGAQQVATRPRGCPLSWGRLTSHSMAAGPSVTALPPSTSSLVPPGPRAGAPCSAPPGAVP